VLAVSGGCGANGPELLPVSGVVTLDGQPVAEAAVLFTAVAKGPAASATTDPQGRFQLMTVNRPGAVAGDYRVTVTKQEVKGVGDFGVVGPDGAQVTWLVPEKYSRPDASGLTATVGRDRQAFDFQLSSP
jgi:hypothetical protein